MQKITQKSPSNVGLSFINKKAPVRRLPCRYRSIHATSIRPFFEFSQSLSSVADIDRPLRLPADPNHWPHPK